MHVSGEEGLTSDYCVIIAHYSYSKINDCYQEQAA
jgi:hypothetical protein